MITVLEANGEKAGRFGMDLEDAVKYFLDHAKQHGLEPINVKNNKSVVSISLYHPKKMPEGWKMPWEALRDLAYYFCARFDESGDPPWDYYLEVEKPLPDPPKGKYVLMDGREAH